MIQHTQVDPENSILMSAFPRSFATIANASVIMLQMSLSQFDLNYFLIYIGKFFYRNELTCYPFYPWPSQTEKIWMCSNRDYWDIKAS